MQKNKEALLQQKAMHRVIDKLNDWGKNKKPFLFIIDFELQNPMVYPLDGVPDSISFCMPEKKTTKNTCRKAIRLEKKKLAYQQYKEAFDKAQKEIQYGNSYLLNLTFPTEIRTTATLEDIYQNAQAPYKLFVKDAFVVFSPEQFVEIKNNKIHTYPMKGTIDAKVEKAEARLLLDEKEIAEHCTIVDLLRNDLSSVAKNVRVNRFRYLEQITGVQGSILQVSSEIVGDLEEDYHKRIGDIIFSLLPAGSISGAPKKKTVEIIKDLEAEKRGYYTGVFGVFDGQNLDSCVMIRFIEKRKKTLFFRSGGGITYRSDCRSEYNELTQKIYVPIG